MVSRKRCECKRVNRWPVLVDSATVRVTCAQGGISICYEQQPIQNLPMLQAPDQISRGPELIKRWAVTEHTLSCTISADFWRPRPAVGCKCLQIPN